MTKTEKEIEELKGNIERAIMCIEARAEDLVELVKNLVVRSFGLLLFLLLIGSHNLLNYATISTDD